MANTATAAAVRRQIESDLESRIPSALTPKASPQVEYIHSGIKELDKLNVFAAASLVEICGMPSAGRTTVLHGLLAECTAGGRAAALVDATDFFDPVSAARAGVALSELLWVRCTHPAVPRRLGALEQALRATDLLLQSAGFSLLVLDIADLPLSDARRIPLATWFRFRRAAETTRTLFLVLDQEPCAGSSGASAVDLTQCAIDVEQSPSGAPRGLHTDGDCLIRSLRTRAEVVRARDRRPNRGVGSWSEFSTILQSYC